MKGIKKAKKVEIQIPVDPIVFAENFLTLQGKPLQLFDYQKDILHQAWGQKFVVICLPKRCGKSLLAAILALHKALLTSEGNIIVLSTSKDHASSVCFRYIYRFASHPPLSDLVEKKSIVRLEFKNGTIIEAVPCRVEAVAGRGLDVLVVDELALIDDEEVVQVALSQTEKPHSSVIIASTASTKEHLLYKLYQAFLRGDGGIHFIYYSGEDAARLNPLLTEDWLQKRKETMPEAMFAQYHLNLWGASSRRVFMLEKLEKCVKDYPTPLPLALLPEIVGFEPKGVVVCAGIDRALPHSKHGDLSAGVVVAKVFEDLQKSPRWVVLDCTVFPTGLGEEIQIWLQQIASLYPLASIVFEVYQAFDLHQWATKMGLPARLEHATLKQQESAFNFLIAAVEKDNIIIPHHPELLRELEGLEFAGGRYKAGKGYHDDCVYALVWAFYETLKVAPTIADAEWV